MDIKFPKAGSARPFELGVRRLHTPDLLQTNKAHLSFSCKMYTKLCMRGNIMHLLKDSWQSYLVFRSQTPKLRFSTAKQNFNRIISSVWGKARGVKSDENKLTV